MSIGFQSFFELILLTEKGGREREKRRGGEGRGEERRGRQERE